MRAGTMVLRMAMAVGVLAMVSAPLRAQMTAEDMARKAANTPAITYTPNKHLYPPVEQGPADLKAGLALAKKTHKRLILDFGGDWCGDCQVLDIYFNQAPNDELLKKNFVKVNINIGREDANLDIAHRVWRAGERCSGAGGAR